MSRKLSGAQYQYDARNVEALVAQAQLALNNVAHDIVWGTIRDLL